MHNNYHGLIINSPNNTIFFNNFLENHNHTFSPYTNNITLNFWDDYTGNDQDENGIGDTAYPISGCNNTDPSPLIHRYGAVQNQDNKEIFFNIQSAIESANTFHYHTIILEPDTYYEHLTILKPITLQGTSPDTCIIDGKDIGVVVTITANTTILADLTIQHSGFNQSDAGILILGHSTHISNTLITQNYLGMKLSDAQNTQINHNHVIENHWIGIMINHNSHNNTIKYNVVQSNGYAGIGINISSDNTIYHNDFIANLHNAYDDAYNTWDNDLPSGGNYWDDYTGIDKNNDGLGDTPYLIQGGINKDRYPLMYPLESYDTTPPAVMIIQPTTGLYIRNHRLLSRLFSKLNNQQIIIIGKINIQAIADDDESGIAQVNFYLNNEPSPQKIDFEPPYQWLWKRGAFPPNIHQIKVVAYNGAGAYNSHIISVKRFL
jgi:parallel beta-helix repeat protein